jgi:hypothetical protein
MANLVNFNKAIVSNGGASYNLMTGEFNPNHGYMVSIKGHEKTHKAGKESYQYEIADYVKSKAIILMAGIVDDSIDRIFLGGWIDNGLLYLDVSYLVDTEEEAIQMAKDNEQIAYHDNAKGVSINV